jgi:hypothetical protein
MLSRILEIGLGIWLLVSPWALGALNDDRLLTANLVCGGLAILLALLSFLRPLNGAHYLTLGVGLFLVLFGYLSGGFPSAAPYQNQVLVGIALMFLAIIGNRAGEPREGRRYTELRQARELIG